ncbi:hypothetical protein DPEC_G00290090 [Dallia pectoralis]|uniref:Uncharacterized protein n=1 Tax=Dallia pectoralis TaxID=75939 RepID=A0ACC2FHA6_DALPE|nr:hypothetical protein DPEC_G00290090 [Dallia pectoralis]
MLTLFRGPTGFLIRTKTVLQDHRSNVCSKPPKDLIGPGQSLLVMSVFALALLAPAGWIMHHIPVYRQRSSPDP